MSLSNIRHGETLVAYLSQREYTTLAELQSYLKLSRRGVFYVIKKVNEEITSLGLDEIINTPRVGYYLPASTKKALKATAVEVKKSWRASERQRFVILKLLNDDILSLGQMMSLFNISKNTAIADLKSIETQVAVYNLHLTQNTNGKRLVGDEFSKRQWLVSQLLKEPERVGELLDLKKTDWTHFNEELTFWEKSTNSVLSDDARQFLLSMLSWLSQRWATNKRYQLIKNEIDIAEIEESSLQWAKRFTQKYGRISNATENYFVAALLQISQLTYAKPNRQAIKLLQPLALQIVEQFNSVAGTQFSERELAETIVTHLIGVYYRYKFKFYYQHPNVAQFQKEYHSLFVLTKRSVEPFEIWLGHILSDDEIALLTIYFGGQMQAAINQQESASDILIVCSSGVGTSSLLRWKLSHYYPQLHFSKPLSVAEYQKFVTPKTRLILTTIDLSESLAIPSLKISPLLSQEDVIMIESELRRTQLVSTNPVMSEVDTLLDIMSNYVRIEDAIGLSQALGNYLMNKKEARLPVTIAPSLQQLLPEENILFSRELLSVQTAIDLVMTPLLNQKAVTHDYVTEIQSLHTNRGPYMAIGNGVFLAHAKPDNGVKKLAMSALFTEAPVNVEGKNIQLWIGLAPVDQTQHLTALSQLFEKIQSPQLLTDMKMAQNRQGIVDLLLNN